MFHESVMKKCYKGKAAPSQDKAVTVRPKQSGPCRKTRAVLFSLFCDSSNYTGANVHLP